MFNEDLFNATLIVKKVSKEELAKELGIHEATLYRLIKKHGDFSREQITKIIKKLQLTKQESENIFFA